MISGFQRFASSFSVPHVEIAVMEIRFQRGM